MTQDINFWKEMCRLGYSLYHSDESEEFCVTKQALPHDETMFHAEFESEEAAIQHIIDSISWESKPTKEMPKRQDFNAVLLYDLGCGPRELNVCRLTADTTASNWYEELNKAGWESAKEVFEEKHPDENWDSVKKDVRVMPIMEAPQPHTGG